MTFLKKESKICSMLHILERGDSNDAGTLTIPIRAQNTRSGSSESQREFKKLRSDSFSDALALLLPEFWRRICLSARIRALF